MKSLPLSLAAGALALGLATSADAAMRVPVPGAPSLVQKAGCYDDDCEYYVEALEEAREEAHEAAAYAAEEYAEQAEEYGYSRPRSSRRQAMPSLRADKPDAPAKPAKSVEDKSPKTSAKKKDVAVNTTATCKQYSPATGMLLSVPCE